MQTSKSLFSRGTGEDASTTSSSVTRTVRLREELRSIVQILQGSLNLGREFVHIAQSHPSCRDRLTETHLQRTGLDVVGIHRQQLVRSHQRDRNNIDLRLDRQKKRPRQKRLDLAIRRAPALWKDHQRHALFQA